MDFERVFGSSPELDLHNDATSSLLISRHSVSPNVTNETPCTNQSCNHATQTKTKLIGTGIDAGNKGQTE